MSRADEAFADETLDGADAPLDPAASDSLLWLDQSTDDVCLAFGTQHSESRFQAVFDAASVGIALTGVDGLAFMANRCFCEMLAIQEASLKGCDLAGFVVEEDRPRHREAREAVLGGADRVPSELRLRRSDGVVLDVRITSSIIRDSGGEPHTVVVVVEDLTERKRLERERVRQEHLQSEMTIARKIHSAMLPRTLAAEGLEVAARTVAAEEVGGDYYDVLPTEDGAWIAIGDVAGHGLPAGIIMLTVQSAVAALTTERPAASPREVLSVLNRVLYTNIQHRLQIQEYVTLSLIRFFRDGRLVLAGAHEDVVIYRAARRQCETLATHGTWIGLIRDIDEFTSESHEVLEDGDVMVLYTDGVTEATDEERRPFGIERLRDAVREVGSEPAGAIVDHVVAEVQSFCARPADDLTVVALRYRSPKV
jgi:PAS domain S-box-containing protein